MWQNRRELLAMGNCSLWWEQSSVLLRTHRQWSTDNDIQNISTFSTPPRDDVLVTVAEVESVTCIIELKVYCHTNITCNPSVAVLSTRCFTRCLPYTACDTYTVYLCTVSVVSCIGLLLSAFLWRSVTTALCRGFSRRVRKLAQMIAQ